jgi:hypothetical protein
MLRDARSALLRIGPPSEKAHKRRPFLKKADSAERSFS